MKLFYNGLLVCSLALIGLCAPAAHAADTLDLKFRDFFANPIGPRGLQPSPALIAADGKHVRLTGFMVAQEDAPSGHFFFTPMPIRMSEHADGEADDLPPSTVVVEMPVDDNTRALPHTPGLLQLTGVLRVGRYQLADGRITWVRLQLDSQASHTGL
jgi:hypothetical protein